MLVTSLASLPGATYTTLEDVFLKINDDALRRLAAQVWAAGFGSGSGLLLGTRQGHGFAGLESASRLQGTGQGHGCRVRVRFTVVGFGSGSGYKGSGESPFEDQRRRTPPPRRAGGWPPRCPSRHRRQRPHIRRRRTHRRRNRRVAPTAGCGFHGSGGSGAGGTDRLGCWRAPSWREQPNMATYSALVHKRPLSARRDCYTSCCMVFFPVVLVWFSLSLLRISSRITSTPKPLLLLPADVLKNACSSAVDPQLCICLGPRAAHNCPAAARAVCSRPEHDDVHDAYRTRKELHMRRLHWARPDIAAAQAPTATLPSCRCDTVRCVTRQCWKQYLACLELDCLCGGYPADGHTLTDVYSIVYTVCQP